MKTFVPFPLLHQDSMYTNVSLHPPDLSSSNFSLYNLTDSCFTSKTSILVFSAFSFTNLLLFPFFFFVLYLDYQQRRQQCSISTSATSHSNVFMYHSITMQLLTLLGFTCLFCGGYIGIPEMIVGGISIWSMSAFGQSLFDTLTCVEHYLAVVRPITYLSLRQAGGIRIRNISVGCVWLLAFLWMSVCILTSTLLFLIFYCCVISTMLIVISFCSISILCALKRPGPGEVGGNRERVQSKQRSFYTIVVITGVLLFKFGGNLIGILTSQFEAGDPSDDCVIIFAAFWIDLPGTLVLPLLFLHRIGKLQCCKQTAASG